MNQASATKAHVVLDYAISKALLQGKVGETVVTVPLSDLINSGEGVASAEEAGDVTLRIQIITSWDGDADVPYDFETELFGDDDETV